MIPTEIAKKITSECDEILVGHNIVECLSNDRVSLARYFNTTELDNTARVLLYPLEFALFVKASWKIENGTLIMTKNGHKIVINRPGEGLPQIKMEEHVVVRGVAGRRLAELARKKEKEYDDAIRLTEIRKLGIIVRDANVDASFDAMKFRDLPNLVYTIVYGPVLLLQSRLPNGWTFHYYVAPRVE